MPPPELVSEGTRLMTICNACRYCEGYCAVFPAMMRRRRFDAPDLVHLANLCHGCRGCYYACQYAPPHAFDVNLPRTLAELRGATYEEFAWPRALGALMRRNGLVVATATAGSLAVVLLLAAWLVEPGVLFAARSGEGAFYAVVPHLAMVVPAGALFGFALLAMAIGFARYWCATDGSLGELANPRALWRAAADAATLTYLGGGGDGCNYPDERFSHARRHFHHATFYGFALCFAATTVAALYEYGLGAVAPYPFWSLPVVLGTLGGIGLIIGPAGLLALKAGRDPVPESPGQTGMDVGFLVLLLATSLTGLALLALRATPLMGSLLALHLGTVLALFVTLPYGKLVHAVYRFAALVRHAMEEARVERKIS